jgi:hypothetical protein
MQHEVCQALELTDFNWDLACTKPSRNSATKEVVDWLIIFLQSHWLH